MAKKYVPVRMPLEAYNNVILKRKKMVDAVKQISNKKINIPLTTVWKMISENPMHLPDEYLIKKVKKKR